MKKSFLIVFVLLFSACSILGQFGYEPYTTINGVEFSYKFGSAKDEDGVKKPALMLKVKNVNSFAVDYTFSVDFYYEGILRETSGKQELCITPHSTAMGKLNGTYFILSEFTEEQVKKGDFKMEINEIAVTESSGCDD